MAGLDSNQNKIRLRLPGDIKPITEIAGVIKRARIENHIHNIPSLSAGVIFISSKSPGILPVRD
jgi:hypothetical protein